ncbi:Shedu immune nuclease family protein [Methylomonas sp. TEB]|uniref:Shedu immune nuclease family protein n=1 Tax=Methylomonas sp. TEB TaxID=3398229 RepID=UPI0039F6233F
MICKACETLVDIEDLSSPYVIRTCPGCDRKIKLREPGDNGHGIKVEKGDQFIFPENFLKVSANPLKSTGHLTKHGLGWFSRLIFVEELQNNPDNVEELIQNNHTLSNNVLEKSELLKSLGINSESDAEEVFSRLNDHKESLEWWAYLSAMFTSIVAEAIEENDARKAAWAMRASERCRSMVVFKESLEEVVWMGHSAGRIIEVIRKWHANKTNDNEEYWQVIFNENPYILSQVFSVPVVFIQDKAYVGGMNIEGKDAKFVDFLYASDLSNDALLVEIKTPETQLLSKKPYRNGVHNPSKEMSGSVLQVLNYRRTLIKNLVAVSEHNLEMFSPKCIVIMGNAEKELDTSEKKNSFELFRTNLKDVEIVTYDELFKKAETLASLFNLSWSKAPA